MTSTPTIDKTALTPGRFSQVLATHFPAASVMVVDDETGEMVVIGLPEDTDPVIVANLLRDDIADEVDPVRPGRLRSNKRFMLVAIEDHKVVIRPNAV